MIEAAIFDMDGILIDSEPLWREAESLAFRRVGIELTGAMSHETLGLRPDEAVSHWYARFPWSGPSLEEVEQELVDAVRARIADRGRPLDGALSILDMLRAAGLRLALASSSPPLLIDTVIGKLGVRDYFSVVSSASDEARGKPHPAVYLTAARLLGVEPARCLAFEDSVPGVRSARAAGMSVVAVPAAEHFDEPDFGLADFKLRSLADFSLDMVEIPQETGVPEPRGG